MLWPGRSGACRACAMVVLVALGVVSSDAADYNVPNPHATLQAAVDAAALSVDIYNVITISQSPLVSNETITIGDDFTIGRRLVIRPAANLDRASVVNENPVVPIIHLDNAEFVTLQDLDILRNVTNGDHIVAISAGKYNTIERCRIGSNWPATGTSGWSNVWAIYPFELLLRNNILFANAPGTFDYGITITHIEDPDGTVRLYNNDVSDYKTYGITLTGFAGGTLVVLRNNVVANNPSLVTEPFAFETGLTGATLVSSHNVAFATAPLVQTGNGQDIAGTGADFINYSMADIAPSFVSVDWDMVFDANPDYYRLLDLGPLHDGMTDYGMNVSSNGPDIAVDDDIEQDYRPGGADLHTDRGADQLEPGTSPSDVGPQPDRAGLQAMPVDNPTRGVSIAYDTHLDGRLELTLFDTAGRRLHRDVHTVSAGTQGTFVWTGFGHPGVVFYRLRLQGSDGASEEITGRVTVVR